MQWNWNEITNESLSTIPAKQHSSFVYFFTQISDSV